MAIKLISAVTLAVRSMERAVAFYESIGLKLVQGGKGSGFCTLQAGSSFLNLMAVGTPLQGWWGRIIFRVDDVDAVCRELHEKGLTPDEPTNGPWGERYFHVTDPDGHELSFAQVIKKR